MQPGSIHALLHHELYSDDHKCISLTQSSLLSSILVFPNVQLASYFRWFKGTSHSNNIHLQFMIHPSKMWSSSNSSHLTVPYSTQIYKPEIKKSNPWHFLFSHSHIQFIKKFYSFYPINISQINLLLSISITTILSIYSCLAPIHFFQCKDTSKHNEDVVPTSTFPSSNKTFQLISVA